MLQLTSVRQILDVLDSFKKFYKLNYQFKNSYTQAVHQVAEKYGVSYQTIADGCRRRLDLDNISEFHDLIKRWLNEDSKSLIKLLKSKSYPNCHNEILQFFNTSEKQNVVQINKDLNNENFTFKLPTKEAKILKALADINDEEISIFLTNLVSVAIKSKFKDLLDI